MAKKQTPDPVALPTQLSLDDVSYLTALNQQMQAAQVAMQSFSTHLSAKYQLQQGDSVTPDGQIVRKKG